MIIDDVIARLDASVPVLHRRVEGAAELSELVRRDALPQVTPAAFVLPLGLRPAPADAATGLYRQSYDELVGVVLMLANAGDATGGRALAPMHVLTADVIAALCGWSPNEDAIGVLELTRGALVSLSAGTVIYQLDFSLQQQLRISA